MKRWLLIFSLFLCSLSFSINQGLAQEVESKNSLNLKLSGRIQLQHVYNNKFRTEKTYTYHGFRMRRVRFQFSGKLTDYLSGKVKDINSIVKKTEINKLSVITSGVHPENPAGMIGSSKMDEFISKAKEKFDFILFDTPPVTRAVDALVLGRLVNKAALVIRPDHSFKESVEWAVQEMHEANIDVCGAIINDYQIEKSSYKYRYGYKYKKSYSVYL